jgi:imidazoleglycerol phosphate dehydratase HisB
LKYTALFIETSATNPDSGFRKGLIRAAGRLHDAGIRIEIESGSAGDLTDTLKAEGIPVKLSTTPLEEALIVRAYGKKLGAFQAGSEQNPAASASGWRELIHNLLFPERKAEVTRTTRETDITVSINLDGTGKHEISTGLGFFDHMLEQIARHGNSDLTVKCSGDLHIDEHHTIEDTALALGEAIRVALGDKRGITRYDSVLPMDETRAMVALDLSGRPYLVFDAEFRREKVGDVPTEMIKHFFYSLAMSTRSTLHIELTGENDHHQIEAAFKGFAIALRNAVKRTGSTEIPSSKGVL